MSHRKHRSFFPWIPWIEVYAISVAQKENDEINGMNVAIIALEKAVTLNPEATTPDGKSLKLLLDELHKTMDQ
jgi:hypothetical protein